MILNDIMGEIYSQTRGAIKCGLWVYYCKIFCEKDLQMGQIVGANAVQLMGAIHSL